MPATESASPSIWTRRARSRTDGCQPLGPRPADVDRSRRRVACPPPERQLRRRGSGLADGRVPHPVRCFTEPVRLARPIEEYDFGLTYINATADARNAPGGNAFWDVAEHARSIDALAVPRDRHEPHGRQQPSERTRHFACSRRRSERGQSDRASAPAILLRWPPTPPAGPTATDRRFRSRQRGCRVSPNARP